LTYGTRELDWTNLLFLPLAHALGAVGLYWAVTHAHSWTLALGLLWLVLCSLAITAGYHRLMAHKSYEAARWLRFGLLLFGAASVQNSALRWVNDHRQHHSKVDRDEDPYNIRRGFLWAHIGWILFKEPGQKLKRVRDLQADPLVMWQHRNYVWLAIVMGALVPAGLGSLWGDAWGGLLVAGFLRLVLQYHATFATNSLAHTLGSRPYDVSTSARDSFFTALFTFGEGYHNFHHRFQNDYRNGVRAWHFDPTKWVIFALSGVGATRNLRRIEPEKIAHALRVAQGRAAAEGSLPAAG
jgi:stearoyl-CoA desaturase (Delta-9 desaturase)